MEPDLRRSLIELLGSLILNEYQRLGRLLIKNDIKVGRLEVRPCLRGFKKLKVDLEQSKIVHTKVTEKYGIKYQLNQKNSLLRRCSTIAKTGLKERKKYFGQKLRDEIPLLITLPDSLIFQTFSALGTLDGGAISDQNLR